MESSDGDELLLQKSSPKILQELQDVFHHIETYSTEREIDRIIQKVSTSDLMSHIHGCMQKSLICWLRTSLGSDGVLR